MTLPSYSTGTVSIANGGTVATFTGAILTGNVFEGDFIVINDMFGGFIVEVTDDTHAKLPKWTGATLANVAYQIFDTSSRRFEDVQIADDLRKQVQALNTSGFFVFVRADALVPDPSVGDEDQAAFQPSTGKMWFKVDGVWDYSGIYKGLRPRGAYDNGEVYNSGDIVDDGDNSYIYINETPSAGHAPPNPTYWMINSAKGSGDDGWSPVIAIVAEGERRVQQIVDWTGGGGTKPATGWYVGSSGFEASIANGVDIRGPAGTSGTGTGDMQSSTYDPNGDGKLANAQLDDMAQATVKGRRASTGSGAPTDITLANLKIDLALNNVTNDAQLPLAYLDTDASLTANSDAKVASQKAVKTFVAAAVAALVASSPSALDTLDELAAALGDDPNFATTMATALGNRLRVDTAAQGLNGTQQGNALTNLGATTLGKALVAIADAAALRTAAGLGNVDNTSDANKPVSNATATRFQEGSIEFVIDGGGATITTGLKGYLEIPFACTLTRATLMADQSGSIVVNVYKDTYANYPPVVGDKITASAPPTISSATKSQDSTLTGWTTSIAAGDVLAFNVDSVATIQRVTLSLKFNR